VVLPGVKTSISTDKKLLVCILSFNLTFNNFKNSSDIIFPLLGFNANYVKSTILTKPDQLNIAEARPDKEDINQVVEKVKHSKWIVLFLSKNQKWFEVWMAELLCCSVDDKDYNSQDICVLPLLYNVEPIH
jgi:hypothetical protein